MRLGSDLLVPQSGGFGPRGCACRSPASPRGSGTAPPGPSGSRGAERSEAQRLRPAELREAAAWAAPRAGEAPASLRYPLPRADSRGNRPKGELVRPRLPPRRPHPLPRRIRPPSGCCPPTPGLGASPPAPARRFPRSSHSEGFCPLALCRGEAPSLRHPSLTLRGKGVGWGQAKKGGSPRLS